MKGAIAVAAAFIALVPAIYAIAEDTPGNLLQPAAIQQSPNAASFPASVDADMRAMQLRQEIRSLRDLSELRMDQIDGSIDKNVAYVEKILLAFLILGALTIFLFLNSMRHQHRVNNYRMRQLIRECEKSLEELRRITDRPDAEHFRVSRNLNNVMHRIRENPEKVLPQRMLGDIHAAVEDPLLPVALHLQASALKAEHNGQLQAAIEAWRSLLDIDGSNPEVLMHLARNYKAMSALAESREAKEYRKLSLQFFQLYSVRSGARHMADPIQMPSQPQTVAARPATASVSKTSQLPSVALSGGIRGGESQNSRSSVSKIESAHEIASITARKEDLAMPAALQAKTAGTDAGAKKIKITRNSGDSDPADVAKMPGAAPEADKSAPAVPLQAAVVRGGAAKTHGSNQGAPTGQPAAVSGGPVGRVELGDSRAGGAGTGKGSAAVRGMAAKTHGSNQGAPTGQPAAVNGGPVGRVELGDSRAGGAGTGKGSAAVVSRVFTARQMPDNKSDKAGVITEEQKAGAAPARTGNLEETGIKKARQKPKRPVKPAKAGAKKQAAASAPSADVSREDASSELHRKAYKSRLDKAIDCIERSQGSRHKKDRKQWITTAISELVAAEKYRSEAGLYKIWGSALVELGTLESSLTGRKEKFSQATEILLKGHNMGNGGMSAELAQVYALLGDEEECRKHLQSYCQDGLDIIDRAGYLGQPEFDIMRDKIWFAQLQGSRTN